MWYVEEIVELLEGGGLAPLCTGSLDDTLKLREDNGLEMVTTRVTGVNVFISRRTFTIVLKNWLITWVADGNSFDMSLVWWLSASKDPRSRRTGPSFHGGTWSSVRKIKGFLGFHFFLFAYFLCMQSSGTAIGLLALEIKSLQLIVLQNLLIFLPWFFFEIHSWAKCLKGRII